MLVALTVFSFAACSSTSVDITFPATMFQDSYMSTFDTEAYAKENDFEKAVVQEDGSIVVTMSKAKNDELLKEMSDQIKVTFDEIIASEDTAYVKGIEHNSDYTEATVDVVRSEYEGAFDMTPMLIYFPVAYHQLISGIEMHCEIIIRDVETGETIKSLVYPDLMQ